MNGVYVIVLEQEENNLESMILTKLHSNQCVCKPPYYIERLTDIPYLGVCAICKKYKELSKEDMP